MIFNKESKMGNIKIIFQAVGSRRSTALSGGVDREKQILQRRLIISYYN